MAEPPDAGDPRPAVQRLHSTDPAQVVQLLTQHLPGLRTYLRLRMGPVLRRHEQSDDLVQSTCREVLEHGDGFEYRSEAEFRAWLWVTAMNKLRDRIKFHGAEKRDTARVTAESEERVERVALDDLSPSSILIQRERMARLEAAFDHLSEEHREVICLSRFCGLSHAELGAQLGKSQVAVRSLLHRALSRLATVLEAGRKTTDPG
jgi:RNA polymerase sigma-70 factor (ECF subfamily)